MMQTDSPVVPMIPLEVLKQLPPDVAIQRLEQREELVRAMNADPFYHAYTPERWRKIDLAVAKKRLQLPGKVIELIVMGGHDGGKTFGCVLRLLRHFLHTPKAACWGLQSTETNSQEVHQQRMYEVFPESIRSSLSERGGAKNRRDVSLKFGEGKGFTNNRFTFNWDIQLPTTIYPQQSRDLEGKTHCGGVMSFKFYESKVKNVQGSKLTCANSDELVDGDMAKTVRQRMIPKAIVTSQRWFLDAIEEIVTMLEAGREISAMQMGLLYTSVHLVGFTPIDGYSPFVADKLDNAVVTEEEEASVIVPMEMQVPVCFACVKVRDGAGNEDPRRKKVLILPIRGMDGKIIGCEKVPVFKQGTKATDIIAYLPTHSNPWTNVDGKLADLEGANKEYVRMTYFGDVSKNWATAFPKFRAAMLPQGHVFDDPDMPKEGSWYHFADFAESRNNFMAWVMADPQDRLWIPWEWPMEGDYIPEEDWGDPGAWAVTSKHGKRDGDPGPASPDKGLGLAAYKREIDRVEAELGTLYDADKRPVVVEQRQGDTRLGNNPTRTVEGSTSIIDEFTEVDIWFDSWSGKSISEGNKLINDALSWDTSKPMGPRNSPKLFVHKRCKAILFALQNFSGVDGKHGACKDPRDVVAAAILAKLQYLGGDTLKVRKGATPYR